MNHAIRLISKLAFSVLVQIQTTFQWWVPFTLSKWKIIFRMMLGKQWKNYPNNPYSMNTVYYCITLYYFQTKNTDVFVLHAWTCIFIGFSIKKNFAFALKKFLRQWQRKYFSLFQFLWKARYLAKVSFCLSKKSLHLAVLPGISQMESKNWQLRANKQKKIQTNLKAKATMPKQRK